jgi:hypothetical protein
MMYNTCLAKGNSKRTLWGSLARSDYRWYSGNYSTKPPSTKPSKYGSLTTIGGCCRFMWLYPDVGDDGCEVSMLLSMKLAELLNLKISTRCLGYRKEVGVVRMWSDMYRDHGEYIWTWLETGEVREWTDIPLHYPPFKAQYHDAWRPPGGCQVRSSERD